MDKMNNDYYSRIKGLFIPSEALASMDSRINQYIDRIGGYAERLEDSYNRNDTAGFTSMLEQILVMLQGVFAKQCEANVLVLLRAAKNDGLEYCQKLLRQSIADFLLLSIEMQKAQYLGTSKALRYRKVERNENVARSLSAIRKLIDAGEYEKARSIVGDMKDVEKTFVKLGVMLDSREYGRAGEMAETMEKEHIGHINRSGSMKSHKAVLAVDDRPEILTSVNAALRGHYQVFGAPGGQVALEIMAQRRIDLFFLDIDMPEMDGFELARRIRADRDHTDTPVLFLTGNSSRDHIMKAIKLGGNDFIVKPAGSMALLAKARSYLDD